MAKVIDLAEYRRKRKRLPECDCEECMDAETLEEAMRHAEQCACDVDAVMRPTKQPVRWAGNPDNLPEQMRVRLDDLSKAIPGGIEVVGEARLDGGSILVASLYDKPVPLETDEQA